jgi:hypothetical protein
MNGNTTYRQRRRPWTATGEQIARAPRDRRDSAERPAAVKSRGEMRQVGGEAGRGAAGGGGEEPHSGTRRWWRRRAPLGDAGEIRFQQQGIAQIERWSRTVRARSSL